MVLRGCVPRRFCETRSLPGLPAPGAGTPRDKKTFELDGGPRACWRGQGARRGARPPRAPPVRSDNDERDYAQCTCAGRRACATRLPSFSHLRFKLEYATHTTSHHHQPRLREMRCARAAHCNPGHTGARIHQRSVRLHDAQEPCVQGHARQGRRRNAARVPGRLGALGRAARSPSVARH